MSHLPSSMVSRQRLLPLKGQEVVVWGLPAVLTGASSICLLRFVATGSPADLQCSVAFAVTAAPFFVAALDDPHRMLHPLSLFGFTMFLGIAGQTAYLNYVADDETAARVLSGLRTEALTSGLFTVSLAMAALVIGYLAFARRDPLKPGALFRRAVGLGLAWPSPRRAFWAVVLLCIVAFIAAVLYAPQVGITSLDALLTSEKRFVDVEGGQTVFGYYRWGMSLAGVGFILAVYTMVRNDVSWRSGLGAIAGAALLFTGFVATLTGSRLQLFAVVATAAFAAIAVRRREPRPARVAAVALLAIVALMVLAGLRWVNQGVADSLGDTVGPDALLVEAFASRNWMDIGPLTAVVERVPDAYDYQYGWTLVSTLWAPIPKTLWPDKPPVRLGPLIGPNVYGFEVDRRTGDPPGIVGELWINGGLIAVAVGMFVYGVLLRRVERWYRVVPATEGLSGLLYGLFVVAVALFLPAGDVAGATIIVLQTVLPMTVLLWFVRSPRSAGPEAQEQ